MSTTDSPLATAESNNRALDAECEMLRRLVMKQRGRVTQLETALQNLLNASQYVKTTRGEPRARYTAAEIAARAALTARAAEGFDEQH